MTLRSFSLFFVLWATPALFAGNHVIQPSDIVDLRKVTDPQVSPDGKQVAYVVELSVKAGEQKNAHIWLVPTDGSTAARAFIVSGGADTAPRWSPHGTEIAFLSDRENPFANSKSSEGWTFINPSGTVTVPGNKAKDKHETQIWTISLHGGEATPLTNLPGGVKSFKWSRDGKQIAFIRRDPATDAEDKKKEDKQDWVIEDTAFHFDRLWIYDCATHATRQVTKKDENIDEFDWSPDGQHVIARISDTPRLNDFWYQSKVAVLNLQTGETDNILTDRAGPMSVRWSRSGKQVAFAVKTDREIGETPVVYDLSTNKQTPFGNSLPATIREMEWNPDSTSLTIQGVRNTKTFLATVDAASGKLSEVQDVPSQGYGFTLSDDGQTLAYLGQSPTEPDDVFVRTGGNTLKQLAHTNEQVNDWALASVEEVSWKSSKDGKPIYGVLLLPPGYVKGTPHKTIIHAHGGPFEAWQSGWLGTWYEWAQLVASHGYVVLAPNPRGSQGQGNNFQEANYKDWGGGDYQDVMDGVDYLIKEKIADGQQLGIGGWSYGGFMTSWTVTHTDRFKAAMVGAGVTDLYGMSTTTDIAPNFLNEFFGSFAANKQLYDAHSPMRFIQNCHTPTLVLHGDADTRVPTFQGQEFYNGLRLLGRETQYVHYPREPHIFNEREHQIDSLQRIIDWFDSHIKDSGKATS